MSNLGNKEIMAKNIQRLMDKKGVDRKDICAALGFKYTTFVDWINAKTYPRIDKIEKMANYFGVSKSELVEEYNSDNPSYYLDPEAEELVQEIFDRPELKVLFDATRNVSKEDIQFVIDMIERMKK